MTDLMIPVSPGELLDLISILEIRIARLTDPEKVMRVHPELRALTKVWEASGMPQSHLAQDIGALWRELWECNRIGWDLESKVRKLESQEAFGTAYIESCRAIHRNNDKRSGLKRAINDLVGSEMFEEKTHS